tara:strand:+ start:14092 stop:14823 length:732 start_codon:yes stop_codon:yes gene_type:complete
MNIEQDITVVVGGTRGIGKVISEVLSERGDLIYTISRRKIKNKNHFSLDLSNEKKLKVIKKKFRSQKIKNLIFCQRYRGNDTKKEYLVSTLATKNIIENLENSFSENASIVIIASTASRMIFQGQTSEYHSSRAALESLSKYYSIKLGPKGIRCNSIMPGTIIKPENKNFFTKKNPLRKLISSITPLRKMADAMDVAYLVDFLTNEKSNLISGQNIYVDGGLSNIGQESIARKIKKLHHPRKS